MFDNLKKALDDQNILPGVFMFKFIAPENKQEEVLSLFDENDVTSRSSKTGKYVSLTAKVFMSSSQDVIDIYQTVSQIKGVIAL